MLGHARLPMPSPPGSGLKPSPPGSGLKPSPPGSGLKPSPPGSGLKPESVGTTDSGQSEEAASAHEDRAEVPREEEVEEEGRAVQDGQEVVVEPQPHQVEQEEEIPEEGEGT